MELWIVNCSYMKALVTEPLKKQKTFMTEFSDSVKNEKIIAITFRIVD